MRSGVQLGRRFASNNGAVQADELKHVSRLEISIFRTYSAAPWQWH